MLYKLTTYLLTFTAVQSVFVQVLHFSIVYFSVVLFPVHLIILIFCHIVKIVFSQMCYDVYVSCCMFDVTDIEVACYGYEGVDAVKEALKCGLNMSTEDMPIKVSSVTHYTVYTVHCGPLRLM